MSKTLYFEGAGWSGADSSKATIGNCRIRTAFHLDPEKKHPRCSCGEPHDGAAAVYLEIICGTIGKENRKLGLEPTYYGWIDYLHYVTDDDRNDDCNRHILPFERRARIDYTLESIFEVCERPRGQLRRRCGLPGLWRLPRIPGRIFPKRHRAPQLRR